jgi:catalase
VRRPLKISGDADRYEQKRGVDDDYIQPGNLFRRWRDRQRVEFGVTMPVL